MPYYRLTALSLLLITGICACAQTPEPLVFRLMPSDTITEDVVEPISPLLLVANANVPQTIQPIRRPLYDTLDLSYKELRTIEFKYCAHNWVAKIDLSHNRIRKFGQRFGKVSTDSLIVSYNRISTFKKSGLFNRLVYLDASNNRIEDLPTYWNDMSRLTYLDLSYNQIKRLPIPFKLGKLQVLNLESNDLTDLPHDMRYCAYLEVLSLRSNKLRTVPRCIGKMEGLKVLDLSDNSISRLPSWIYRMQNLTEIDLSGNLLEPEEIERLRSRLPGCRVIG